tara:strand:+ start:99 stop:626 length:528 start_codon:yes stop_codon:yes gene_type:complete
MSVYKLTCSETNQIYYGSTKMTLKERKNKGWYKCSCKDFINPLMECIEVVDNLEELEIRENHYIMNNECVNKNMAYMDAKYKKIRDKEWRERNIEHIKENLKLNRKKVMDEKRFECQLCNLCFQSNKKLERHKDGYRHKLKNESFIKYGEDWKKYYLEDNKKRYKEIRRAKNKSV